MDVKIDVKDVQRMQKGYKMDVVPRVFTPISRGAIFADISFSATKINHP